METEYEDNNKGDTESPLIVQTPSVKVMRNSRGYTWEVKILKRENETDEDWLNRVIELETKLAVQYGGS